MRECKFSWHDCSWKTSFKSIYDSIHGNHDSNSHALIPLPESVLPSNPGIETSPCDFLAQSRPTDAPQNSNIFQGMFATHSLKKEDLPHIHAVAQSHGCTQGRFLIGISQARLLLSQRKQNEAKSLENQLCQIHRYFIQNFSYFLKCFTPYYRDAHTDHQRRGKDPTLVSPSFPTPMRDAPSHCCAWCNGTKVGEVEGEPSLKIKSISDVYKNQTRIPSYFNVSSGCGVMENGVIY